MQEKLTDINQVCKMLGTTSRTLRFYESKGIITSTKKTDNKCRQYTTAQIDHIKKVLVLRSLGLSIAKIAELQQGNTSLSDTITLRKAEINASIITKLKEIRLLTDALATIEAGGDIFSDKKPERRSPAYDWLKIADSFTKTFLSGDLDGSFSYFATVLQDYMPLTVFKRITHDTLKPLGNFIRRDKIEFDREFCNIAYSYLEYENLGLYLKLVFHKDKIHGFWFNYYEYEGKKI